jgi:hypothetical protein
MFLAGEFSHKIEAVFFAGFKEFLYGFGLWEVKMLWVQVMGLTLMIYYVSII